MPSKHILGTCFIVCLLHLKDHNFNLILNIISPESLMVQWQAPCLEHWVQSNIKIFHGNFQFLIIRQNFGCHPYLDRFLLPEASGLVKMTTHILHKIALPNKSSEESDDGNPLAKGAGEEGEPSRGSSSVLSVVPASSSSPDLILASASQRHDGECQSQFIWELQNSAFQPSQGRLLYIHPVGWSVAGQSSGFVTVNSTSIKPSVKVRNLTFYIFGESL